MQCFEFLGGEDISELLLCCIIWTVPEWTPFLGYLPCKVVLFCFVLYYTLRYMRPIIGHVGREHCTQTASNMPASRTGKSPLDWSPWGQRPYLKYLCPLPAPSTVLDKCLLSGRTCGKKKFIRAERILWALSVLHFVDEETKAQDIMWPDQGYAAG